MITGSKYSIPSIGRTVKQIAIAINAKIEFLLLVMKSDLIKWKIAANNAGVSNVSANICVQPGKKEFDSVPITIAPNRHVDFDEQTNRNIKYPYKVVVNKAKEWIAAKVNKILLSDIIIRGNKNKWKVTGLQGFSAYSA